MNRKLIQAAIAGLLIIGAGLTVADYRQWRRLETGRYGQGPGDLQKPAQELAQMYQSKLLGIRVRFPAQWQVKESPGAIEAGGVIKVTVTTSDRNLVDIADSQVKALAGQGIALAREREYLNTDTGKMDMTVITYNRELPGGRARTVQMAMGRSGQKLITAEVTVPEEEWGDYEKTVWEIYKSIEVI